MMPTIIDGLTILLLIGSIAYGYVVSRKVRRLMATLHELQPLVRQFSHAVDKSEQSVHQMRQNIEIAEQSEAKTFAETAPIERGFTSQRVSSQRKTDVPSKMRVLRDKQELVKAFFENTPASRVET